MHQRDERRPFGLLFEEPAKAGPPAPEPEYDEAEDLSFIVIEGRCRVPYVEALFQLGTETETRVAGESTDEDPQRPMLATETETKVRTETTDEDPGPGGTQTFTEVQTEATDRD